MSDFLDKVRAVTIERVNKINENLLEDLSAKTPMPPDFMRIFENENTPIKIIAEVKFSSPAYGEIRKNIEPISVAKDYLSNGAAALSILTEPKFFNGDIQYIQEIKKRYPQSYILMKDFVLHELQLMQARAYGANAVLLIAVFLSAKELEYLFKKAIHLGLTPLVEIYSEQELTTAMQLAPRLIAINNRNLKDLAVDLNVSRRLIEKVPDHVTVISASGFKSGKEIKEFIGLGFDGFLIGSSLMQNSEPGIAMRNLIAEAEHEN